DVDVGIGSRRPSEGTVAAQWPRGQTYGRRTTPCIWHELDVARIRDAATEHGDGVVVRNRDARPVEDADAFVPEPDEAVAAGQRRGPSGVDWTLAAPGQIEQPAADLRAQTRIAGDVRDRHELDLRRRQRQCQTQHVVDVGSDVRVKHDAPAR